MAVWIGLQEHRSLWVDPEHPDFAGGDFEYYGFAYGWLRDQMARRLPHYQGHYPWWAYDYKLDLRVQRYQMGQPGARNVRIALAVPRERVLPCGYGSWHFVLNKWYLPYATGDDFEEEDESWDSELRPHGVHGT